MLESKIVLRLNAQLNMELYSAYLYLDIYSFYFDKNLTGFANWFYVQAQEERDHAMLMMKYLLNNSEKVVLTEIKAPTGGYENFRVPISDAFDHERLVTASINSIYADASAIKDFRTMQFLDWFVKEQGEEEMNVDGIAKKYDLFGGDPRGLYLLDGELAARVYAPPTLVI